MPLATCNYTEENVHNNVNFKYYNNRKNAIAVVGIMQTVYCMLLVASSSSEVAKTVAKKIEKKGKKLASQAELEVSLYCFIYSLYTVYIIESV